jgi:hypothetical protein
MMKTAMTSGETPDLSKFALNQAPLVAQPKTETPRSLDVDEIKETKTTSV